MIRREGERQGRHQSDATAPSFARGVHERDGRSAYRRIQQARPGKQMFGIKLAYGSPCSFEGTADVHDAGDNQLDVNVESGVIEEPRMELAGSHHVNRALGNDRLVRAKAVRQTRVDVPEPKRGADEDNRCQDGGVRQNVVLPREVGTRRPRHVSLGGQGGGILMDNSLRCDCPRQMRMLAHMRRCTA